MQSNNSSQALKAGVWYAISNIALRAIGIVTAPIFTRLLTPADYGKFNNFFSWQTILACIFGLCLNYSIGRAKIDFKEDFEGFVSSIQTLSALVGICLLIILFPFLDQLSSIMEIDKGLLISLLVMLIVSPSIDYLQSKFRFEYRYKENVLIALVNSVGVVVLSIILILLSDSSHRYIGRILGSIIPVFGIGVFAFFYLYRKGKQTINMGYWRYALRISLPMIPHGLAMVLLAQIDNIMLIKMAGDTEAGLYGFGYSYALIITVVTNAIMNAWQPWLYDNVSIGNFSNVKSSNNKINLIGFLLMLFFILVGPEVIMILGTPSFYDARWMVAPVIVGCYFQFVYGYFSLMEIYCKKTELIAFGSVGAAVLKITLNLLFIPQYKYIGAAYTTMISYALLMIYHWVMFKIVFKEHIFDLKQLAVLCMLSICSCFMIVAIYNQIIIRYVILLSIMIIATVIFRKTILLFYNKYIMRHECRIV